MTYDIRTKDGIVIRGIPDNVQPDDQSIKQRVSRIRSERQVRDDPITQGAKNFNADASFGQNALAGAGKSVADLGLGARQLVGAASQEEVDETKRRDALLMDTAGGITGDIAGNVAMSVIPGLGLAGVGKAAAIPALKAAGQYAMSSPATLGGIATQGGMGALQSGMQPVATGESRAGNTALGAIGGGAVPAAGMAIKGVNAALEPAYQSGREAIMGRTLRRVAGGDAEANAAAQALRGAKELVPGSLPTAGQAADNAGIAAVERAAFAVEPSVTTLVAKRLSEQNAARVEALRDMAGTSGQREFYSASRAQAADDLYSKAYAKGVDIRRHPETGQFLPKAEISGVKGEITKMMRRPAIQDAMAQARTLAQNEGVKLSDPAGSVKGLDYLKRALDDKIGATQGNEQRILVDLKHRLLTIVDRLSPDYAQARMTFAEMSKPLNQMDTAQAIANKAIRPLDDQLTPAAYARALSDDTAKSATGFKGATLANTMEPDKMAMLEAIKKDLARSRFAETAGRGVGSDTVQKMAYTNLMQQSGLSGLPNLLNRPVQLAEYGSRMAYGSADKEMRRQLAEALLDPKRTAELMQAGIPSETARKLGMALRAGLTPVGVGAGPAMLDVRQ